MSVSAIWTAHCDQCANWNDYTIGDTKAEAASAARRQGWLVTKDRTLCDRCRAAAPEEPVAVTKQLNPGGSSPVTP